MKHAMTSIYAIDQRTGTVLIDEHSDLSVVPASTMKVVTTAAALFILRPETRFETALEYDGTIENGVLHGNLYIRGGGDPCLGSDRTADSLPWKEQIKTWCDAIAALGVKKIEGEVIGDASRWEKTLAPSGWCWEDLGNYYGAGACALSFHENLYSVFFKPANQVGDAAAVLRLDPPISTITFFNDVKTGAEGSGDCACIYGSEFSNTQFLRGTIPFGVSEFAIKGAIPDPAAVCSLFVSQELEKRGISVERGNCEKGVRTAFHTTYSPTVKDIAYWTNQKSINLYAEHLLKKIGEVILGEGSTTAGIKAVTEFWRSQGVDLDGFNMADGSGLSRKNLLTAKQLVGILSKVKSSKFGDIFIQSLPQKGDKCKAKSGFMSQVRGYAGYMDDIVFAVIVNNHSSRAEADGKIEEVLVTLADKFSQQPVRD